MMEQYDTHAADGPPAESVLEATDLVSRFLKALKGYRLYLPNNQILKGFVDNFCEGLDSFLKAHGDLALHVSQFSITFEGETVYENEQKEESLAFRFFIHGVREINFHPGVPDEEVTDFLQIIHRAFDAKTTVDDLLTLLWEREFQYITFIILDDFFEEGDHADFEEFLGEGGRVDHTTSAAHFASGPALDRMMGHGESEEEDGSDDLPSVELTADERERLAAWIEVEKERELADSLCAVVLEILSGIPDPTDSVEILGVLNRLLDMLLDEGRIREAVNVYAELTSIGRQGGSALETMVNDALTRIDGTRLVRAVTPYLARCPVEERDALVEVLASQGQEAISAILDLLEDPDLRESALSVLTHMADDHMSVILTGLKDSRPPVVAALARLLGEIGDIRALTPLRVPLQHSDMSVRRETIRAVEKIGTPASVAILSEVLSDSAPEIRVAAVRALAALPSERTREPLVALSRHKEFSKRTYLEKKEVFLALGRLRDPEIENWLIGVLKKRSWFAREEQDELRACAVSALAILGSDRAWKEIRAREKDKSPQVRRAVAQVLRG
jgi:HEAT repeat protein